MDLFLMETGKDGRRFMTDHGGRERGCCFQALLEENTRVGFGVVHRWRTQLHCETGFSLTGSRGATG
jgi:hypothetical protein